MVFDFPVRDVLELWNFHECTLEVLQCLDVREFSSRIRTMVIVWATWAMNALRKSVDVPVQLLLRCADMSF